MIAQGDVWWADLAEPMGSAPGYRRPVVVVQSDSFNRSAIRTVLCVTLTTNLRLVQAPGNVQLGQKETGLRRSSVANVTQIVTLDRAVLTERVGGLSSTKLDLVLSGIELALGRS